jgi:hypothetical protein
MRDTRRKINPMHVFQDDDPGRFDARFSKRSADSRSMRSCAAPKTFCWNAVRSSSRHLRQPRRRVLAKRFARLNKIEALGADGQHGIFAGRHFIPSLLHFGNHSTAILCYPPWRDGSPTEAA